VSKIALITGISGQDGSYLAEFLLKKNYAVHGMLRRSSVITTDRIDHLINDKKIYNKKLFLHYGDLTDENSVNRLLSQIRPNEIYNLAAQSHVKVSFEVPMYTANLDALGPLRILEGVKSLKLNSKIYQASTSEIFGDTKSKFMNEKTNFSPVSPYGIAKLYAYEIIRAYRKGYNIFASNGILFNHESPRRGETFVTKKITAGLKRYLDQKKYFELGNLKAKRDWGHAKDYIEGMWKLLQYKRPTDMVFATGQTHSVEEFLIECLDILKIKYKKKIDKGITFFIDKSNNKLICKTNKRYYRPNEVHYLKGNAKLAKKVLKWKPKFTFKSLVKEMINSEFGKRN
jgi:GDPmannose 4,6-dehydratase